MHGFSSRNLLFMRRSAEEFPDAAIVKQLASQLPCRHVIRFIQSVKEPSELDASRHKSQQIPSSKLRDVCWMRG
jgi:hypothetical protein